MGGVSLSVLGDILLEVLDSRGELTNVSIADPAWFATDESVAPYVRAVWSAYSQGQVAASR